MISSIHQFPPGMHIHEYLTAAYSYKLDSREMIKARSPGGGYTEDIVIYKINTLGLLKDKAHKNLLQEQNLWREI